MDLISTGFDLSPNIACVPDTTIELLRGEQVYEVSQLRCIGVSLFIAAVVDHIKLLFCEAGRYSH